MKVKVKLFRQTSCLVLTVLMAASSVLAGAASPASLAASAASMAESCHQALMSSSNTDSQLPAPVSPNRYMCCVAGHEAAVVRGFHVQIPLAELAGGLTESHPAAASGPPPHKYRIGSPPSRDPHPMRI